MTLITPNSITNPKISKMFVFQKATDTTPTAQLWICSGIAVFNTDGSLTGADISIALPNLTVSEGQVLETTALVSINTLGINFPNPSPLSSGGAISFWSIDTVTATQDGSQVVVNANVSLTGASLLPITSLAYHVTLLLRMS